MQERSLSLETSAFALLSSGVGLLTLNSGVRNRALLMRTASSQLGKAARTVSLISSNESGMRKLFADFLAVDQSSETQEAWRHSLAISIRGPSDWCCGRTIWQ